MLRARLIEQIGAEPITLEEAYHHLRLDPIDSSDTTGRPDDALIQSLIVAAREYCENFTGRALVLKRLEVAFTAWPDPLELPHPPFVALDRMTISDDASDADLDPDDYSIDDYTDDFAVISAATGTVLPAISAGDVARVRYLAGYGDESEAYGDLPSTIKQAMLLLLGHWYGMREAVADGQTLPIPFGVEALLRKHRVKLGFA